MKKFVLIIFLISLVSSAAFASDISFEATISKDKISLGEEIQLKLTFNGTQNVSAPQLPDMEGLESRYIGPSSMMSIVNGNVSTSISHIYKILPLKAGLFKIGPFTISHRGTEYTARPITIEVVEGPVSRQRQAPRSEGSGVDVKDKVFVIMEAPKKEAYINEIVPVKVKLYVSRLAIRDIQFPKIPHEAFSMSEYANPRQYRERDVVGEYYDVIEFNTNLFGTRPGRFVLGPTEIDCNLITKKKTRRRSPFGDFFGDDVFDDFFDKFQTYPLKLKSTSIPITVLPLPEKGRPEGFSGAVGDFDFTVSVNSDKVLKVGDPITLKMVVRGDGNLDTVSAPRLESKKGFKVYKPKVIEQSIGAVVYEQIIMPTTDSVTAIPGIAFTYFNPKRRIYQSIKKGEIPIHVIKPLEADKLKIVESPITGEITFKREALGADIVYVKESIGNLKPKGPYLYQNKAFILLQVLPLLLLISLYGANRRSRRLKTDIKYARLLHAPKGARMGIKRASALLGKKSPGEFYDSIFKTLREYLGDRYHIAAGGITADVVDSVLAPRGLDKDKLERLKNIFRECDMARYAPSEFGRAKMADTLNDLKDIIDYLQRHKS